MGISSVQNLRGFAANQPPLLLFTVCLMAFGLTMVVLAYVIGESDMPNPDVTVDWNVFLQRIAELHMCVQLKDIKNRTSVESHFSDHSNLDASSIVLTVNSTNMTLSQALKFGKAVDQSKSMGALLPDMIPAVNDDITESPQNVTLSVSVPLRVSSSVPHPLSLLPLNGLVQGHHFRFKGKGNDEFLNVGFSVPPSSNLTGCGKFCSVPDMCLTFQGSSVLLPKTRRPSACQFEPPPLEGVTAILSNYNQVEEMGSKWCQGGAKLAFGYTIDPELTVMLSIRDRSIVNLHLMHTSYFLFVMVMTLLCFALIRGRYRTIKSLSSERILLDA